MEQVKKIITRIDRYLLEMEAKFITIVLDEYNYKYKLQKISEDAYFIELPNIDKNNKKDFLKKELNKINSTIYKTNKSIEDLRTIYRNKIH